jgi:hypothetical protein
MLWRSYVCVVGTDDTIHEPPDEVLGVVVISGVVYLTRHRLGEDGNPLPEEPDRRLQVPARALLHALRACIEADEDEKLGETYHRLLEDARKRNAML